MEIGDAVPKREMARQFDKANQISSAPAAVTKEETPLCVDVERGMGLRMQRAESHELRPLADPLPLPVVPMQVIQQRKMLFEPFEILAHGIHTSGSVRLEGHSRDSQPRMVGKREKSWFQRRRGQGQTTRRKG